MNKRAPEIFIYTPAIAFEALLSRRSFRQFHTLFILIGFGSLLGYSYSSLVTPLAIESTLIGIGAITASILITLNLFRFFHNAFYYRGFAETAEAGLGMTYEVARIFYHADGDITASFIRSPQGNELMKRLGLTTAELQQFISKPRDLVSLEHIVMPNHCLTFSDLGKLLFTTDTDLRTLCAEHGITETIYTGTLAWTTRAYYAYKHRKRWWAKDNLSRFAGIGREWSYGTAFLLQKFSRNVANNSVFSHLITDNTYATEKVAEIEKVLARSREANVLLVGEPGVGKMDILLRVAERVRRKTAHPSLADRRFIVLDTEYLMAQMDTKQSFEQTFLTMLQQAAQAGNIVLIIENLSGFIRAGASIQVDIPALIETYLGETELNLIFTDSPGTFHHELEQLGLLRKIEVLFVEPPSLLGTERLLEDVARQYEVQYGVTLTYPALKAIAVDADRYIPTGVMPDKAVDLLVEVMSAASQTDSEHVTEKFVQTYVAQKTGIPVGPIDDTERATLLDLEGKLHERVVGQDRAVTAIASAMRRARAGIQDTNRPMGSFLFLGPTGVGKTETAKALATVFFGASTAMQRLDMSEYSGPDALERLLGTSEHSGKLSEMMHEHPYAVVLLDEFEKGSQSVHDLFLQILDEGRYTDARGTTVNMRNTIVIATSNAGSGFIIEAIRNKLDLDSAKDAIIREIIQDGTYRPELINRFDGVILFEPLTMPQQAVVAEHLITELVTRIEERGYTVQIASDLVPVVARAGYHPEFGARPMRRFIQDNLEEILAKKIIGDNLQKGDTITLAASDLATPERVPESDKSR